MSSKRRDRAAAVALGIAVAILAGCAVQVPPQPPPPVEMPPVAVTGGPLAANRAWVVFDTPGDRANVFTTIGTATTTDSDGNASTSDVTKKLCTTPCVYDLRLGRRDIEFDSTSDSLRVSNITLDVQGPMVVRQALPVVTRPVSDGRVVVGLVSAAFGATSIVFGSIASATSPTEFPGEHQRTSDATHTYEKISAVSGVGCGFTVLAFLVMAAVNRGAYSPGATTVFPLSKPSAQLTDPGAVGLRF